MNENLSNELGYLRVLAQNLERTPIPTDPHAVAIWKAQDVEIASGDAGSKLTILPAGREPLSQLANCIVDRFPAMERGTVFDNVQVELFNSIDAYVGRGAASITRADVEALLKHFETWFQSLAQPPSVFVPCVISPWPAPRFRIGPIDFVFIEDIAKSEFYPSGKPESAFQRQHFDELVQTMRRTHGNWLAQVPIEGCELDRAQELAELAVDLALTALQLGAPRLDTRSMCRLDARRGFAEKKTLSLSNGHYNWGIHRKEPGLSIGEGTLQWILSETHLLHAAVGHVAESFVTGRYRLPNLERA